MKIEGFRNFEVEPPEEQMHGQMWLQALMARPEFLQQLQSAIRCPFQAVKFSSASLADALGRGLACTTKPW